MGPKKGGGNEKVLSAKERKDDDKKAKESKAAKQEEDTYWQNAGDGAKSKSGNKKDEADKKAQEAAVKRAEAKRLSEQEEAAMASSSKPSSKQAPKPTSKVTQYQLQQQKDFEATQKEAQLKERDLDNKREVTEDRYSRLVSSENLNRQGEEQSARNVEEALAVLGVADDGTGEKHPEKRMKQAWAVYQEAQLPELRADKPGLKLQQYKDMIWKNWQKSPENPMNQAAGPTA